MKLTKTKWYILIALTVVALVGLAFFVTRAASTSADETKYSLLAKRIFLEDRPDLLINFSPLRQELRQYLASLKLPKYSFYFEYLPTGTSVKVNEDSELVAASLIKVFLVMNLYKTHELGRINLDDTVTIDKKNIDPSFGSLWKRGVGATLTLREAARLALTESDNTAADIIFRHIDGKLSEDEGIFNAADIAINFAKDGLTATINAKSYASAFKCLYFSCYLEIPHSQELLGYLSESRYDDRLAAPLPNNVTVANKYGTFSKTSQSDCGIVYVPKRNYVFCAMLWTDSATADQEIAELSKIVYDFVIKQ
jgi:beta-lactamase class A